MVAARPSVLPFAFVAGHAALDFTNTVSWGGAGDGLSEERLDSYGRLLQWVEGAELPIDAVPLYKRAKVETGAASRTLTEALELRADLHELFHALSRGGHSKGLVARFNGRLSDAIVRMELQEIDDAGRARFDWRVCNPRALDSPIHWIVWQTATLLATNQRPKRCANPSCGWVFLDHSRRGNRRWCEMAVCGSRHKARMYYRRQKRRRAHRRRH